ncbi:MAG: hypothetical protein COV44_10670 [Deltaproteobacteria bacterium CG11_big_fil_rev_8_21_14_0_20_45_16]|nr:MAG: hypothetical protein COV44_10670 [Deltaproteobacteria bacterium CG11_big_fil_rev_8_21_14_0_20_45_16]
MTSIFLAGHGFWDSKLIAFIEHESLRPNFFELNEVESLVKGCFKSLAFYDQLDALRELEARESRFSEAIRRAFYERVQLQDQSLTNLDMANPSSPLTDEIRKFMDSLGILKKSYEQGRLEEARALLEALLPLANSARLCLIMIQELYIVSTVPNNDWVRILSWTGNELVRDLSNLENGIASLDSRLEGLVVGPVFYNYELELEKQNLDVTWA